jgi:DNA-binding transcriptional MerR regulator
MKSTISLRTELRLLKKENAMLRAKPMTIGQLSRRSGVPIKLLRTYDDFGFVCTRGRSESNYRLFGEEALRCVQVVQTLRSLGLTLKEIQALIRGAYRQPGASAEELLEEYLARALARIETQISALQARRQRLLELPTASAGWSGQPAVAALTQILAANLRCDPDHVSA